MSHHFNHEKTVPVPTTMLLGAALLLCAPLAVAQNNLGELLDAGAKVMSAEEFKREVVQRMIVGPTASGGSIEVMYTANGSIAGTGTPVMAPTAQYGRGLPVSGEWKIDDNERICTSMRISMSAGAPGTVALPPRCQVWFKYRDEYFIADTDTDRRARVFRRTVQP